LPQEAGSALWKIATPDPGASRTLAEALGVSPLVGQLLLNRGVSDPEAARLFLDPQMSDLSDPHRLPDVGKAVDRLALALDRKERIFVHGDYDVDGVTSAALCLRALAALGADIVGYVPKRTEGYDLQKGGVDRAKEAGATLILTADCGSCAIEPVAYANSLGIDVIVTDHHRPGAVLPDAVAVVNPYREEVAEPPPFQALCGAGVAFKVLDALVERIAPAHRKAFRDNFVDLAALGTVADMTPLVSENRILVSHGLRALNTGKKVGLRALFLSMDLGGKTVECETISFRIAPRLNAAGRMEDADLAYRLLVTRDADEAEQLAVQLGALAEKSREETARVTAEAVAAALEPEHEGRRVLVLAREAWGKGVIGVAANRVMDQFRRPVILLSLDKEAGHYHGSARSFGAFNLHQALHACADLLGRFGGHSASAGVSVPAENLEAFRDRMHDLAEGLVEDEPVLPAIDIDAEVAQGSVLTYDLVDQINRLAPFGRENPEPTFLARGAMVLGADRVGKDKNTFRIRLRLPGMGNEMKGVWFKNGDWADRVGMGDEVDVVFTPKINEWNGRVNVEMSIKDLRVAVGEVGK
jgi:single-stranded-DNA-specific exonuclease